MGKKARIKAQRQTEEASKDQALADSSNSGRHYGLYFAGTIAAAGIAAGLLYYSCRGPSENPVQVQQAQQTVQDPRFSVFNDLEERLETNMDAFVDYMDSHLDIVAKLTSSSSEVSGYIKKSGDGYVFEEVPTPGLVIAKYCEEFLKSDFSHKKELLSYQPMLKMVDKTIGDSLPMVVYLMESVKRWQELVKKDPSIKSVPINDPSTGEEKMIPVESMESLASNAETYFLNLKETCVRVSIQPISLSGLKDPSIISRFHTHPKEDPNYSPAPLDMQNSLSRGPCILLSQKDGFFHAYSIMKGEVWEVYRAELSK